MKLKSSDPVVFDTFNSSAIHSLTFYNKNVEIVWNGSDKSYKYTVNDSDFVKTVEKTIKNSESIGKLVNKALKDKIIQIIEDNNSKINNNVV